MFTIPDRSGSDLQLLVIEVLYITIYQPAHCKQKESSFVQP